MPRPNGKVHIGRRELPLSSTHTEFGFFNRPPRMRKKGHPLLRQRNTAGCTMEKLAAHELFALPSLGDPRRLNGTVANPYTASPWLLTMLSTYPMSGALRKLWPHPAAERLWQGLPGPLEALRRHGPQVATGSDAPPVETSSS